MTMATPSLIQSNQTAPKRRQINLKDWHNQILCGDCVDLMKQMPDASVDAVITSPPYFQQRNYQAGGIGNEKELTEYLASLLRAFAEVVRITKPTGNIIYNLGDKYKKGGLLLVPFRFALAAVDAFSVSLINNITWIKRNPTPRQYKRRLVSSTEPFFHFVKATDYYYDHRAFMTEETKKTQLDPSSKSHSETDKKYKPPIDASSLIADAKQNQMSSALRPRSHTKTGDKYRQLINTSSLTAQQKELAYRALDKVVEEVKLGKLHSFRMKILGVHAPAFGGQDGGRKSQMERDGFTIIRIHGNKLKKDILESAVANGNGSGHVAVYPLSIIRELVKLVCPVGGIVLDPYIGSGTTALAAQQQQRAFIGMDINPDYCDYARRVLWRS